MVLKQEREGLVFESNRSGSFEVIEYRSYRDVTVRFVATGFEKVVMWNNIIKGKVKDLYAPSVQGVGYLGVGGHQAQVDGKGTKMYVAWCGMFERSYCPKFQAKRPTYIGCSVCEEWHCFQDFGNWFELNHPNDGKDYHLDKDIKVKGNKVYSPDTCLFVSNSDNSIEASAKHYIVTDHNGVEHQVYNLADFCRERGLFHSSMYSVAQGKLKHHKGWGCRYV